MELERMLGKNSLAVALMAKLWNEQQAAGSMQPTAVSSS